MAKNKKVMSIAIKPDLHDELKRYAKRKGQSVSEYVGMLIARAVKINIDDEVVMFGKPVDEDVKPVILKIPTSHLADVNALKGWLETQVNGILSKVAQSDKQE